MANDQGAIPLNADKILFTEDLIYWYLINRWPLDSPDNLKRTDVINNSVDIYRESIYIAFDGCMERAIRFIDDFLRPTVWKDFDSMLDENRLNAEAFNEYASDYYGRYFSDGFDASRFLEYCAHLANMAGSFHSRGINVLPQAVDHIVKAFPEGDMTSEGWDILKKAAKKFVKLDIDSAMQLTPEHSSDDSDDSDSD